MKIKIVYPIFLSSVLAYLLWLRFSGFFVAGFHEVLNLVSYILFCIFLVFLFLSNIRLIIRIDSKPIKYILIIFLLLGILIPYYLAKYTIDKRINENHRHFMMDN